MKWGWLLVTLYTGPIGAAAYVLTCQESAPGTHADFVRPLWKQAAGSTIHCLAGDATGIIFAAAISSMLGFAMWHDLIAEYAIGFAFGLFIFQALFMREMLGGSYARALRVSFIPEWLSMNAVMAGMIPVMVVLMSRDMGSTHASSLRFWAVMSLATLVGAVIAYPVNVWLVAAGLKHGMGTTYVLGKGGHEPGHEIAAKAPPPSHRSHGSPGSNAASLPTAPKYTRPQLAAVTVLTLLALGGGIVIGDVAGDLSMRPDTMRAAADHPGM